MIYSLKIFLFIALSAHSGELLNILDIKAKQGWSYEFDYLNDVLTVKKNNSFAKISKDLEYALLDNGYYIYIDKFVYTKDAQIYFTEKTVKALSNYFSSLSTSQEPKITSIIIDPGHGGRDRGAFFMHQIDGETFSVAEKDVNLTFAKNLYELLRDNFPEKNILISRTDDTYLSLQERTKIANNIKPKFPHNVIFLSIHANSSKNLNARGLEIWYMRDNTRRNVLENFKGFNIENIDDRANLNKALDIKYKGESRELAEILERNFKAYISEMPLRGLKSEDFIVIKNSNMPALLIELGFISNREDASLLLSQDYIYKVNFIILMSIKEFIDFYEKNS